VLASVLERPFVSRAGVPESAFWYSLQANFISLAIGYVSLPLAVPLIYSAFGLFWCMIAFGISVVSEGSYYQRCAIIAPQTLRWGWVVVANFLSSFVLLLLPTIALVLKEANPNLQWKLAPYQNTLFWASITASSVLFIASFFAPRVLRHWHASPDQTHQRAITAAASESLSSFSES
jgi:hypothetical protein